jgi:hypothetical protein
MEFESKVVLCATHEHESVDKETKKPFTYYQVCLEGVDGLNLFTCSTDYDDLRGKLCVAKFKNFKYDGKDKLKLVSLEKEAINA